MCEWTVYFPDEILLLLLQYLIKKITLKFRFLLILDLIYFILLLKTGPTSKSDQVSQGCVPLNSECLERWRFHKLSRKPVPVLYWPPFVWSFYYNKLEFFPALTNTYCLSSFCCTPLRGLWLYFPYNSH